MNPAAGFNSPLNNFSSEVLPAPLSPQTIFIPFSK